MTCMTVVEGKIVSRARTKSILCTFTLLLNRVTIQTNFKGHDFEDSFLVFVCVCVCGSLDKCNFPVLFGVAVTLEELGIMKKRT